MKQGQDFNKLINGMNSSSEDEEEEGLGPQEA